MVQSPFIEISGSVDFEGEDQSLIFKEDPRAVVELYDADRPNELIQSW